MSDGSTVRRRPGAISRLMMWSVRARSGLSLMVIAAHFAGLAVIVTELWLIGFPSRVDTGRLGALAAVTVYPALAILAGIGLAIRDRTSYFGWLDQSRKPTPNEARRLLHLPIAVSLRAIAMWTPGVVISAALLARLTAENDFVVLLAMFTIGGLESAGLTYLVVDRVIRPVVPIVAGVLGATMHWSSSVFVRVALAWAVSGAMPLSALIVVLADPASTQEHRIRTGIYLAAISLAVGVGATWALARAVATPLRALRIAVDRITQGDLDVRVPVGSASEIGRLEHSVNEMSANLRERLRLRNVFDRHVGEEVAERALAGGVDLTGDVREVTALFVDVTGSVAISTGMPPQEFVAKLNRLLATVVSATEDNDGLVNKFEGDAALCIFGAPIALADNATPALRAARRIRDEIATAAELDIGIGVARGRVFAGDLGTDTRREYTVIGDAVNAAARLTTRAKEVPRRILVSQSVVDAATADEQENWVKHGAVALRGITEATSSWTDREPGPTP